MSEQPEDISDGLDWEWNSKIAALPLHISHDAPQHAAPEAATGVSPVNVHASALSAQLAGLSVATTTAKSKQQAEVKDAFKQSADGCGHTKAHAGSANPGRPSSPRPASNGAKLQNNAKPVTHHGSPGGQHRTANGAPGSPRHASRRGDYSQPNLHSAGSDASSTGKDSTVEEFELGSAMLMHQAIGMALNSGPGDSDS